MGKDNTEEDAGGGFKTTGVLPCFFYMVLAIMGAGIHLDGF